LDIGASKSDNLRDQSGQHFGARRQNSSLQPRVKKINRLRLPVFEHPMFPRNSAGLEGFELPLRLGLIFDTTLVATRLIYSGVFERYPDFPYIMAHY
jgi:aminocarboxymuconate-semialdehyde decarboxylase